MTNAKATLRGCLAAAIFAAALFGAPVAPTAADDRMVVGVDRAQLLRVDVPVDTVIIGNPTIADAAVYDQTTLIITGKTFGDTNLIVMDSLGKVVREVSLTVSTSSDTVTVHKAGNRLSYTCAPVCERTLRTGDSTQSYEDLKTQVTEALTRSRAEASQQ